ncbi:hypothetical protein MOX02_40810 [Methylobacterium oxalidis]|uniref:Uncharacterized protein n=1 Tax=Methylobacterium oxalidis TaxID=944322 RepID=A0A512J7Y5_9HYPH|nr:hypothetical protein MOX02_40810 [Methylobacterium oxalidis]GLS64311.1 hypothetical protein GCM10007888_26920 [Methylobacterium oxalidis]
MGEVVRVRRAAEQSAVGGVDEIAGHKAPRPALDDPRGPPDRRSDGPGPARESGGFIATHQKKSSATPSPFVIVDRSLRPCPNPKFDRLAPARLVRMTDPTGAGDARTLTIRDAFNRGRA